MVSGQFGNHVETTLDYQNEGGTPERNIAVHQCAMADGLEHACRVRVQTLGLRNLTDVACMPDLTVKE